MDIYYRYDLRALCDSNGDEIRNATYHPKLPCQSKVKIVWHFLHDVLGVIQQKNMSGPSHIFWTLAVDKDWSSATPPMARATDAEIDKIQASQGKLTITLNTNTTEFLAAVDNKDPISVKMQLKALDGYAEKTDSFVIGAVAQGDIDLAIDPPAEEVTNHYTKVETDALLSAINTEIEDIWTEVDEIVPYSTIEANFLKITDAETTYATKNEAEDSAFLWAVIMG